MGKGSFVTLTVGYLLFGACLKLCVTDDFESNFYTVAVWFLVGRHPLVSFLHYSHCPYHLVIKVGQKKILRHLQAG